ncbi:MAG: hypothetical protein ABIQ95_14385 [Bdellovibrionia bacterium]
MAKTHGAGEKTKETQMPAGKPAEAKAAHEPKAGESKKPEAKGQSEPKASSSRNKGHTPLPGHCFSWACKAEATRFNFCDEHYEHFKFGLVKKTGEPVSDYEKKIEHYLAYKKRSAQKVA